MPRRSNRTRTATATRPRPSSTKSTTSSSVPAAKASTTPANVNYNASVPSAPNTPASSGPGIMGAIAANAASHAMGYAGGRMLYDAFSGGSNKNIQVNNDQPEEIRTGSQQNNCEADTKAFMECMKSHNDDISACQYYLDMMKRCR
ncbi:hypothetical protein ROZALSC1DRAFT_371, partial [Rozella allomycis CSF55]